jgi:hypothetical protein
MDAGGGQQAVKLPLFAGAPKDFQMFWVRFMAFAAVKNFVAACVVSLQNILSVPRGKT